MNTEQDVAEGTDLVLASLMASDTNAGQAGDSWISNPVLSRYWDEFTLDRLVYMPDEDYSQTLQQWSRYKEHGGTNSNFEDLLEQIEQELAQGPFPDDGGVNQLDDTNERFAVASDYQDESQTGIPIVTSGRYAGTSRAANKSHRWREKKKQDPAWVEAERTRLRNANTRHREKLKASRESHGSSAAASVPEEGNDDDDAGPAA